jgi:Domain of unknown function (DUF397)
MTPDTTGEWRKSSRSNGNDGDCVEVSRYGAVRDSKNRTATLNITWPRVALLVAAIKHGDFDQ